MGSRLPNKVFVWVTVAPKHTKRRVLNFSTGLNSEIWYVSLLVLYHYFSLFIHTSSILDDMLNVFNMNHMSALRTKLRSINIDKGKKPVDDNIVFDVFYVTKAYKKSLVNIVGISKGFIVFPTLAITALLSTSVLNAWGVLLHDKSIKRKLWSS